MKQVITITREDLNSSRCSMTLLGPRGNGPTAQGTLEMPLGDGEFVCVLLWRNRKCRWSLDYRAFGQFDVVQRDGNQIVGFYPAALVRFADDIPTI